MTHVLVGLGNPGSKYSRTRHNVGFQIAIEVAKRFEISLKSKKFTGGVEVIWGSGRDCVICLPQTYMNESGKAVRQVLDYYRLGVESLFVVHDDIDFKWGRLKLDFNAGSAGQRGVQSIIDHLGSKEFGRLRVGMGRPENSRIEAADYVLGKYSKDEEKELVGLIDSAFEAIKLTFDKGLEEAQRKFNKEKKVCENMN